MYISKKQKMENNDAVDKNNQTHDNIWLFSVFYSRLWLVVCWTFNLQNVIDQLSQPREQIPPVQVTQTDS